MIYISQILTPASICNATINADSSLSFISCHTHALAHTHTHTHTHKTQCRLKRESYSIHFIINKTLFISTFMIIQWQNKTYTSMTNWRTFYLNISIRKQNMKTPSPSWSIKQIAHKIMSQGMHYSFISYSSHAIFVEVSSFSFPSFWPFYHLLAVLGLQQRTRVLRCSPTACTWLVPVPGGGRIRKQDVRSKNTLEKTASPIKTPLIMQHKTVVDARPHSKKEEDRICQDTGVKLQESWQLTWCVKLQSLRNLGSRDKRR